jgi:hypothetical protein
VLSVARDLDDVVLSFIVLGQGQGQGGTMTLDPANSKTPGSRTMLSTLEMKRLGQYVCVSATDDSTDANDRDASSNSDDDSNTTLHAESRWTPNIGYLGMKIFRTDLGPSFCPLSISTPLRVYALLALIRSTAVQKPQVRSDPIMPCPAYPLYSLCLNTVFPMFLSVLFVLDRIVPSAEDACSNTSFKCYISSFIVITAQ